MTSLQVKNCAVADTIYSPDQLSLLDPCRVPHHVAIIMDGNRRWAKQKRLPSKLGHLKGAEVITKIVQAAIELNVKVLTVYAFSTENWERSNDEINDLMDLFKMYLYLKKEEMIAQGVRLDTIGDLSPLSLDLKQILNETKRATSQGRMIDFVLALNYGGRDEIRRAAISLAKECQQGILSPDEISEEIFSRYLDTAKWNDPDLLIRTSGEQRLSNFLLWQVSYSEVYITETLWPDFSEMDFLKAILTYQQRERRGGL